MNGSPGRGAPRQAENLRWVGVMSRRGSVAQLGFQSLQMRRHALLGLKQLTGSHQLQKNRVLLVSA